MAVQTEKIVILKLTCNVCGYRWEAKQKPVRCAKCKTPYWDKQRKAVNA